MAHFVIVQLGRDVSGPWLTLLSASIPLSINSLIELLQVRKEEMPEAIKTLQMMLAITQEKCSSYRRRRKGGRVIGYMLRGCTRLRRWRGGRRLGVRRARSVGLLNLTASGSGSGGDGRPRDTLITKAVMDRGRCARCNVDHDA
jgi:hypothetical protein